MKGCRFGARRVVGLTALIAALGTGAISLPASGLGAAIGPVFGKSFDARALSGTVLVTPPGGRSAKLTGSRHVPVGSVFDVSHGSVQLTASTANGGSYSGRFSKGSFQAVQSATGDGTTVIQVLGKRCAPPAASDDPSARAARLRHHAPAYRQLQIAASGNFLVVGRNASAVASGQANYSLVDTCSGTQIVDETGKVVAQRKNAPPKTLKPGDSEISYCHPAGANPTFCQILLASPRYSTFGFAVGITQPPAPSFRVCYVTPAGQTFCFTGPLTQQQGTFESGDLACYVNDGPGVYPVRFYVNGAQLGITLHFKATQPRQVFLGQDSCSTQSG